MRRRSVRNLVAMLRSFRASGGYFNEETYSGAPAGASAELGAQILDLLAGRTAEAMAEILEGRLPRDQWHSPFWKLRHVFVHPWSVRVLDVLLRVPKATR